MRRNESTLRYCGVEIGPEGVAELDHRGRVVFVATDRIRRVVLRRGVAAERPGMHVAFALVCFAGAFFCGRVLVGWWTLGGTLEVAFASGVALLPLGFVILWAALRPRVFLRVEMDGDARHVVFAGRPDEAGLRAFLENAEAVHGLHVEREVASLSPT